MCLQTVNNAFGDILKYFMKMISNQLSSCKRDLVFIDRSTKKVYLLELGVSCDSGSFIENYHKLSEYLQLESDINLKRVLLILRAGVAKNTKIQCTSIKLLTQPAILTTCQKKSIGSF